MIQRLKDNEKSKTEPFSQLVPMNEELLYKIAMTRIPKVGSLLAKNLISYCGGVEAVFRSRKSALCKIPGIGETIAKGILKGPALAEAEKELRFIEDNQIRPYFYLDEDYPQRLKPYHDSPIMLYFRGKTDLNHTRIVSIVGTRTPSKRGIRACEELLEDLAAYQVLVVSGLAYGVDGTAHRKCLDLGIPTVGVLGHGLSMVYPAAHQSIAKRMLENGGLLSEFPSDTEVEREHFPMRNRIIAGLCDALVVVETANKGGSMISARMANNYSKDVFAVPGRLSDPLSAGCNHLIKSHQAALLESAEDIAYVCRWSPESNHQQKIFPELSTLEQQVVSALRSAEEIGIDKLSYETNLSPSELASLLLNLEFKGLVETLPGKRYVLV